MIRLPDLALGEVERAVLEVLWADGPMNPVSVHERVGEPRGISVNTVSSAMKRLHEKGLLSREKVSHAYVYATALTRAELQRQLIDAIGAQFDGDGSTGMLAAFVDVAGDRGEATLRRLEALVAERLAGRS